MPLELAETTAGAGRKILKLTHFRAFVTALAGVRSDVVDRLGPVVLQEPRERTVGEQPAAGLAARAIVALVLRVDDPLHGRAAHGAGLLEAAVHRHLFAKRRHLLGKAVAGLGAQQTGPLRERGARCLVEASRLLLR